MKSPIAFVLSITLVLIFQSHAASEVKLTEQEYAEVNLSLVDTHILPRYAHLSAKLEEFEVSVSEFCSENPSTDLESVRQKYHQAMDAWMGIEHIRFGPVELFMRSFRFFFWPQSRGKVVEQLQELAASIDQFTEDPSQFSTTSVSVQGLLAAEALLFRSEQFSSSLKAGDTGCAMLSTIAKNMSTIAEEVITDWNGGIMHFRNETRNPGSDDALFENHQEVTAILFKSLHDELQLITEVKMRPVLGKAIDSAHPELAESRPSERSLRNIAFNLEALQAMYTGESGAGLSQLVSKSDIELDELMHKAFNATVKNARSFELPLEVVAVSAEQRPQADKLFLQVRALRQIVRQRLASALSMRIGFNTLDGD